MSFPQSSTPLPILHTLTLTDWLPKLGEKAFLAWLRLHSWKDPHHPLHSPFMIDLPLSQVNKRLKVGNSTFYNQIIRPLYNYGLANLQYVRKGKYIRLIIYAYPLNQPEQAEKELILLRNYDEEFCAPSSLPEKETLHDEFSSPNQRKHSLPNVEHTSHLGNQAYALDKPVSPKPEVITVAKTETFLVQESSTAYLYQEKIKEDKKEKIDKKDHRSPSITIDQRSSRIFTSGHWQK